MNERNARAALMDLRQFLAESGASLQTIDAAGLNEMEGGYMREVRRFVPCARLIGVPRRVERRWLAFARLYCAYLLASGRLEAPCLVLVSVPGKERAVRPARRDSRRDRAPWWLSCRAPSREVMKPFEFFFHAQWTA